MEDTNIINAETNEFEHQTMESLLIAYPKLRYSVTSDWTDLWSSDRSTQLVWKHHLYLEWMDPGKGYTFESDHSSFELSVGQFLAWLQDDNTFKKFYEAMLSEDVAVSKSNE